jgi:hypothetical protein
MKKHRGGEDGERKKEDTETAIGRTERREEQEQTKKRPEEKQHREKREKERRERVREREKRESERRETRRHRDENQSSPAAVLIKRLDLLRGDIKGCERERRKKEEKSGACAPHERAPLLPSRATSASHALSQTLTTTRHAAERETNKQKKKKQQQKQNSPAAPSG